MSQTGKEISIRTTSTALPDIVKRLTTITDLFNLVAGDNLSAIKVDLEDDSWPDLDDIENENIDFLMESFLAEIDVNDIKTLQNFGKSALDEFEKLYQRFSQNSFLNSQLEQATDLAKKGARIDTETLMGRLEPLFETKEEKSEWRRFFDKYNPFAEEEKPEITPQDIIRETTEVEMDLNAQTTMLAGMASKSRRLIISLQMQKENLQAAYEELQQAEVILFLAFKAGREVLLEWQSDKVVESYLGLSPMKELDESEMPESTEFNMPNNAQKWADSTFELNMRLMRFYNAYTESREYVRNIPASINQIDDLIEFYSEVEQELGESWKDIAEDVRANVEYIRAQVAIKKIMRRAEDLAERRINHEKFMKKVESWKSQKGQGENQPQPMYERIIEQSAKEKEEMSAAAIRLDEQFAKACDVSDYHGEKLGLDKMERPSEGLMATVEKSKRNQSKGQNKKRGLWGI